MENNDLNGIQNEGIEAKQKEVDFDFDFNHKMMHDKQQADFDFDKKQRSMELNFDMKQREESIRRENEDIAFQRKRQSLYDQDEIDARKEQRQNETADRESSRRLEELERKSSIAMRNMQAMMEAKRAARQDELLYEKEMQQSKFEAEERRMQTQKEMTPEQIMAAQIREMDASAQAKFAETFSVGRNADREREVAEEKAMIYEQMMQQMQTGSQQNAQMQQQMMQQMMEMAKMGFQANANVATGRIDALRENLQQSATLASEPSKSIRLNTLWLRQHGYKGSFNELAGQLANLGGNISQDFDEGGNPVIVVDQLTDARVMDVLLRLGVTF